MKLTFVAVLIVISSAVLAAPNQDGNKGDKSRPDTPKHTPTERVPPSHVPRVTPTDVPRVPPNEQPRFPIEYPDYQHMPHMPPPQRPDYPTIGPQDTPVQREPPCGMNCVSPLDNPVRDMPENLPLPVPPISR